MTEQFTHTFLTKLKDGRQMSRNQYLKELDELHMELIKMGGLVEEQIDNSIIALKKQDKLLAKKVHANDDIIDELEKRIERRCLNILAKQQPIAQDLRNICSALKIITDLERIGDHASDIAEIILKISDEKYLKPLLDIPKMAAMAKQMVNMAIDSYIKQDTELAKQVCVNDDNVDNLFYRIVFELTNLMKNNPDNIEQAINFIFIVKYLERMSDHATNICEWTIYAVTGEHDHMQNKIF